MNLDQLKDAWRSEMSASMTSDQTCRATLRAVKEQDRQARFGRNVVMAVTFALVGFEGFVLFFVNPGLNVMQIASMVIVPVVMAAIAWQMTRALHSDIEDDWTLASRLAVEMQGLQRRAKLYQVTAMLMLPLFVAVVLGSVGGYYERTGSFIPDSGLTLYLLGAVVLFAGTAWIHLRSRKKTLEPLERKLSDLAAQLREA